MSFVLWGVHIVLITEFTPLAEETTRLLIKHSKMKIKKIKKNLKSRYRRKRSEEAWDWTYNISSCTASLNYWTGTERSEQFK